jgi:hypothetical protein
MRAVFIPEKRKAAHWDARLGMAHEVHGSSRVPRVYTEGMKCSRGRDEIIAYWLKP